MEKNNIKKIEIFFDENNANSLYDTMLFTNECIIENTHTFQYSDIQSIEISMCSSQGENGMVNFYFVNYYVDIYITTHTNNTYKYQIMNSENIQTMFDLFVKKNMKIIDPISIQTIFKKYSDPVARRQYINKHFKQWSKQYNLDNPRDNYLDVTKDAYFNRESVISDSSLTVGSQIKLLGEVYVDYFKKNVKKIISLFKK